MSGNVTITDSPFRMETRAGVKKLHQLKPIPTVTLSFTEPNKAYGTKTTGSKQITSFIHILSGQFQVTYRNHGGTVVNPRDASSYRKKNQKNFF